MIFVLYGDSGRLLPKRQKARNRLDFYCKIKR